MKKSSLLLTEVADFSPFIKSGQLVAFNVGPDYCVYAVFALNPLDVRSESRGGSFPKCHPESPQNYRVVSIYDGVTVFDIRIESELFNIHSVQPLPNDRLLLACARSRFRSRSEYDKNGRIYSKYGRYLGEILLGDGIQDVQTTADGTIWTSFFDEGVFGNFGWHSPVGAAGLVAWESDGTRSYEFEPTLGLDSICDCYAMNVESDVSTWIYYYTGFPLVHIRNRKIAAKWEIPVSGCSAFAVCGKMALFAGGYDTRDEFFLVELSKNSQARVIKNFHYVDEHGDRFKPISVVGRAETLYVCGEQKVYSCEVNAALNAQ